MNKQEKATLKARGKTTKDLKDIESIARRAKTLFDDCNDQGVLVHMASGNRVQLICGGVLLATIAYPK